jgi:hypothetical protein
MNIHAPVGCMGDTEQESCFQVSPQQRVHRSTFRDTVLRFRGQPWWQRDACSSCKVPSVKDMDARQRDEVSVNPTRCDFCRASHADGDVFLTAVETTERASPPICRKLRVDAPPFVFQHSLQGRTLGAASREQKSMGPSAGR